MEIKDLQPGQGSVNIEVTVKSVEEPKEINKYGKVLRLTNAIVTDSSGEIKLTLWNEDVDKVKEGSKIKITNGYVNEFNGEKQLTSGKFGKLEILNGEESNEESSEETKPEVKEEKPMETNETEEKIEDY
jgi:replication factor A1